MSITFDYGICSIGDIKVSTSPNPRNAKRRVVDHLEINGEALHPSPRFWYSLCSRFSDFGVTKNLYNLYDHEEVFTRLTERASNDRIRYTIERRHLLAPVLLAATSPERPHIGYDGLIEVLSRFGGERITYSEGMVNSLHTPRIGSSNYHLKCGVTGLDHEFTNRFMMEVPIDGYGKPVVFPSVERVHDKVFFATRNATALKSEITLGKGLDVVYHAVCRALDSYNSDEGFAALRQRMQASVNSWCSVYEANQVYKLLTKEVNGLRIMNAVGLLDEFHKLTGDTSRLYGIASLDDLAAKRQRNLPVNATVYSILGFLADIATRRSTEVGRQNIYCHIGQTLGDKEGYDLELSRSRKWAQFSDFRIRASERDVIEGKATTADSKPLSLAEEEA